MSQKQKKKTETKMKTLGNNLTLKNRPSNRPRKVLESLKGPKKEQVRVLYPKKGTSRELVSNEKNK